MAPLPDFLDFLLSSPRKHTAERTAAALGFSASQFDPTEIQRRSTPLQAQDELSTSGSKIQAADLYPRAVMLEARDGAPTATPGKGVTPPNDFNNAGMLALFAILGAGMVVASLWFFFWAKNGGFKWRKGDWEDYKSTVLRRKGPDGKTLSNATKSTKLGGGTIAGSQHYKWQQHIARSVVGHDEKGRKGIRAKRGWAKTHSITYSDSYLTRSNATQTVSDMTEVRTEPEEVDDRHHSKRYRDRDVQDYKREKPARVGGMNRVADGSHYDYSQSGSDLMTDAMTESSEQPMLQKKPAKKDKQQRQAEKEKERAERKAREQAAKMERRWKREAEEAAASTVYERQRDHDDETVNSDYRHPSRRDDEAQPPPPRAPPSAATRKSAMPSARPAAYKQRRGPADPAAAPLSTSSRDFSYTTGDASEVLSTIYSDETGARAPSYYDSYRPRASEHHAPPPPRYSADQPAHHAPPSRSRQSSPRKKASSSRYQGAGYRRGGMDSDLE